MTAGEFQTYIEKQIPIVKAMGIVTSTFSEEFVELKAPLDKNINHRDSAFGGSISSLLVLSCWAHIFRLLLSKGMKGTIVIQDSHVDYYSPVQEDLTARSFEIVPKERSKLFSMLDRFGKARVNMKSELIGNAGVLAEFSGRFVIVQNIKE